MGRRIAASPGVIWYRLSNSDWVLAAPNRLSKEKCLLLGKDQKAILDKVLMLQVIDEDELDRDQQQVVRDWLRPELGILEEVGDQAPVGLPDQLAWSVFQEYTSAKALKHEHDISDYYREVADPWSQFEKVEMTVSHLYRHPHPALDNMSYGARFARVIMDEGGLREGMKILEVGCGTGLFGREFLREVKRSAPRIYGSLEYTFFDISPVLLRSQREENKEHGKRVSFQVGGVQEIEGSGNRYDIVIANEMIADLPVVRMARDRKHDGDQGSEGWAIGKRLGLDFSDAPPLFILNLGALEFIVLLSGLLKSGGYGYIVEYGSSWGYPKTYYVTNHKEYSIHFGHLIRAAQKLGLGTRLVDLSCFLKFKDELRVLESRCHRSLFDHLLPFLGVHAVSSRVYTEEMLAEEIPDILPNIENLDFVCLNTQGGIIYPKEFYVMILEKK